MVQEYSSSNNWFPMTQATSVLANVCITTCVLPAVCILLLKRTVPAMFAVILLVLAISSMTNDQFLFQCLSQHSVYSFVFISRCGCEECIRESTADSLRHSLARLNEYRALASPSLIALSSTDPVLTAFQLSWELRNLAFAEQVIYICHLLYL